MFQRAIVLFLLLLSFPTSSHAQIPETIPPVITVTIDTPTIQFYKVTEDASLEPLGELPADFTVRADSSFDGWMVFEGAVSPGGNYFAFSATAQNTEREPFKLFIFHFETAQLVSYPLTNIYTLSWLDENQTVLLPSGEFLSPIVPLGEEPYLLFDLPSATFTVIDRYEASALFFNRSIRSFLITYESPPECEDPCAAYRSELYSGHRDTGARRRLTNLPRLNAPEPFASVEQRGICFSAISQIYERIFVNACAVDWLPEYFFSIDLNGNVQHEDDLRDLIGLSREHSPLEVWRTFERGWNFYMAVVTTQDRLYLVRYVYPSGWGISFEYEGTLFGERYLRDIQMSPDGRFILIQTSSESSPFYQNNLEIFDIETGQAASAFSYLTPNVYYPIAWLNNERFAFAEADESGQMSITIFDMVENTTYAIPETEDDSYMLLPVARSDSLLFPVSFGR